MLARFCAAAIVVSGRGGTVRACALLLVSVFSLCPPLLHERSWTTVQWKAGCLTSLAAALCASVRLSLAAHENQ